MSVNVYDSTNNELTPIAGLPSDFLDAKQDKSDFNTDVPFKFGSVNGIYGYYKQGETVLTAFDDNSGGTKLADVSGASATTDKRSVTLIWTDPNDYIISGVTIAEWAGTKVVRKIGSAPSSYLDGTLIVDSIVRDQYSSTGFTDSTLEYGNTYYYRFFPYTDSNAYTDGTSLNVTPTKTAIIAVPSQDGSLTYDGTELTASFTNYNSEQLTVTGNSATNAGTYTARFTPKTDYVWSDGDEYKDVEWSIGKASGSATLSTNSVTLDADHLTATVTVSGATGDVSVSSSDATVATASMSDGTVTISNVNETTGTTVVTVSIAESSNYLSTSYSVSVTASFFDASILLKSEVTFDEMISVLEQNNSSYRTEMVGKLVTGFTNSEYGGKWRIIGKDHIDKSGESGAINTFDLMTEDSVKRIQFGINRHYYKDGYASEYVSQTFYNAFTSEQKAYIKPMTVLYAYSTSTGGGSTGTMWEITDIYGKILSLTEVGTTYNSSTSSSSYGYDTYPYMGSDIEGTKYEYFNLTGSTLGSKRIKDNDWWLRSRSTASTTSVIYIYGTSGFIGNCDYTMSKYAVPVIRIGLPS